MSDIETAYELLDFLSKKVNDGEALNYGDMLTLRNRFAKLTQELEEYRALTKSDFQKWYTKTHPKPVTITITI